jgi:hypothetical protein
MNLRLCGLPFSCCVVLCCVVLVADLIALGWWVAFWSAVLRSGCIDAGVAGKAEIGRGESGWVSVGEVRQGKARLLFSWGDLEEAEMVGDGGGGREEHGILHLWCVVWCVGFAVTPVLGDCKSANPHSVWRAIPEGGFTVDSRDRLGDGRLEGGDALHTTYFPVWALSLGVCHVVLFLERERERARKRRERGRESEGEHVVRVISMEGQTQYDRTSSVFVSRSLALSRSRAGRRCCTSHFLEGSVVVTCLPRRMKEEGRGKRGGERKRSIVVVAMCSVQSARSWCF